MMGALSDFLSAVPAKSLYDMTGNFLGSALGLSVALVLTRVVGRGLVVL